MDDGRVVVAKARRVDADNVRAHCLNGFAVNLARPCDRKRVDDGPVPDTLERHVRRGRILLIEPGVVALEVGVDLGLAPGHLLVIEAERLLVLLLLGRQLEVWRHLAPVLLLDKPRDEHSQVVALAGHCQRPHRVKQVGQAVGC